MPDLSGWSFEVLPQSSRRSRSFPGLICFCVLLWLLPSCANPPKVRFSLPEPLTPTPRVTVTPTPTPTDTPTPTPTSTPPIAPTTTPLPTGTPRPTATSTPMHPLMIASLRQRSYPGSEVVIEETLDPGVNYDRYLASYRSEGLKIYALLTVPRGKPPENGWPVIIFNHGYIPPSEYRTTERYIAYVDGFARKGYIVFRSDYRGHGDSEGVAWGPYDAPDYAIDVLNAVATMKAYPAADPERIGMWGHSMGGSITLQAMVTTKDVKVGVIWAGVVGSYMDILKWRQRQFGNSPTPTPDPTGRPRAGVWGMLDRYGTPEQNPAFWDAISPTAFLSDLSGPLQLHHGTSDASVPYVWSEDLYAEVRAAGKTIEFYSYEGDDHNLSKNFKTAMAHSVEFFDRYLKEEP
ncbi:MAG: alpha/beta fold hydrolase [Anaerolineae bacterium]|nr:alpha/beta fold hydrolase [Anaerolineae bacterium]